MSPQTEQSGTIMLQAAASSSSLSHLTLPFLPFLFSLEASSALALATLASSASFFFARSSYLSQHTRGRR